MQRRVTLHPDVGHRGADAGHELVAQSGDAGRGGIAVEDGVRGGGGQADAARQIERARTHLTLLAAAVQQGHARDVAAQQQCAGTGRAAELVSGHGQGVDAAGREVDGERSGRLHGVGVHRDAELAGDRGQLGNRLDRADLVVGPHDRDQRERVGVARHDVAQRVGRDAAVGVDRQGDDLGALVLGQPVDGVQHGMVLDSADDDPAPARVGVAAGPEDALDREVVGLGAAGGEDDLRRARAEGRGQLLAGLLDPPTRGAAGPVQRRGVAHLTHGLGDGGDGVGKHRGRGSVVQVGHRIEFRP